MSNEKEITRKRLHLSVPPLPHVYDTNVFKVIGINVVGHCLQKKEIMFGLVYVYCLLGNAS